MKSAPWLPEKKASPGTPAAPVRSRSYMAWPFPVERGWYNSEAPTERDDSKESGRVAAVDEIAELLRNGYLGLTACG